MIGIVVVSHSHSLATAAVGLAREMVPPDSGLQIAVAAGLDAETIGTDAAQIEEAILAVDSPDGVLVLLDLGSALLSTELALEFLDEEVAARVLLTPAPFVEGLIAAVVTAASGAPIAEVDAEARAGSAAKLAHLGGGDAAPPPAEPMDLTDALTAQFMAPRPHGLHARPAAVLVAALRDLDVVVRLTNLTTGASANGRSVTQVAALGALADDEILVAASGPGAAAALGCVAALAEDNFGDPLDDIPAAATASPTDSPPIAGTGIAVGPVFRPTLTVDLSGYEAAAPAAEEQRSRAAHAAVMHYLEGFADDPIFVAQASMLSDEELVSGVSAAIAHGASAPDAWSADFGDLAARFESLPSEYLRERAQDVRSLERLVLLSLTGQSLAPSAPSEPSILVLEELDATTAKSVDRDLVRGIITTTGGRTGHGVLVATSRAIPVLAGCAAAQNLKQGVIVAIDATDNTLLVDPDAQTRETWEKRSRERADLAAAAHARASEPALTVSGKRIMVEANIASLEDAVTGRRNGAEGSGLVRTELLFAEHRHAPTAAEQADLFVRIGRELGGMLTVRTWDVGGDKPLPFIPQGKEDNPFLGERGLRTMRRVPEVFREQLRAIAMASTEVPVRVLVPMVTDPDEVHWVRNQLAIVATDVPAAADLQVGIMVEVPAAAVRADQFRQLVDFVSVGTNDLTQYALAADRGNAAVADLAAPGHPAVLDLIAATCAGIGADIPVAVCGDLASDPKFTARLVERGVTELSVQPVQVPLIKEAVRAIG